MQTFGPLKILKDINHFALSYDKSYVAAKFATRLRERWDVDKKLTSAFEELIDIIDKKPDSRLSSPNLMEGGWLPGLHVGSEKAASGA